MTQTGSGGLGAVSIGISEWMLWLLLGLGVIALIWIVAKFLLAALKG